MTLRMERSNTPSARPRRHRRSHTAIALAGVALLVQIVCGPATAQAQNFGPWGAAVSLDPHDDVGVNMTSNDGCPIEAPDGDRLFFASNRLGSLDIWVAYREDGRWTVPDAPLPFAVNTGAAEFCPTPLPGNQLLFVSTRANNCGDPQTGGPNADIYYTRFDPAHGEWTEPRPLGCTVNTVGTEFSPSLVEAEGLTTLFFSSDNGHPGTQKIYMSVQQPEGSWAQATEVTELNRDGASDARPNVRKDGLEIVFDSTRDSVNPQIFTATRSSVFEPWDEPVPILDDNIYDPAFQQTRGSLSWDGTRLYFGSNRDNDPGDPPGSDIFVATRSGPGKGHKNGQAR